MIDASALNIAFGVTGAEGAMQAMNAVSSSFMGAAQSGVQAYASVERLQASYKALISQELQRTGAAKDKAQADQMAINKAQELYELSQSMAILSPFNLGDIAVSSRMGASFGFLVSQYDTVKEAQDAGVLTTQRLTQAMLDFSAATGLQAYDIPVLTQVFGQIKAVGKAQGDNLNQLKERGLNVNEILVEVWGKSSQEINKMQEQGKLLSDDVLPEVVKWIERMYGGAAAEQGGTMSGLLASLEEIQTNVARELFTPAIELAKPKLQAFVDYLQGPDVAGEIEAWGARVARGTDAIVTIAEELPKLSEPAGAVVDTVGNAADAVDNVLVPSLYAGATAWGIYGVAQATSLAPATTAVRGLRAIGTVLAANATIAVRSATAQVAAAGRVALAWAPVAAAATAVYFAFDAWQATQREAANAGEALISASDGWKAITQAEEKYLELSPQVQEHLKAEFDRIVAIKMAALAQSQQDLQALQAIATREDFFLTQGIIWTAEKLGYHFQTYDEALQSAIANQQGYNAELLNAASAYDVMQIKAEGTVNVAQNAADLVAQMRATPTTDTQPLTDEAKAFRKSAVESYTQYQADLIDATKTRNDAIEALEVQHADKLTEINETARQGILQAQRDYDQSALTQWQTYADSLTDSTLAAVQQRAAIEKQFYADTIAANPAYGTALAMKDQFNQQMIALEQQRVSHLLAIDEEYSQKLQEHQEERIEILEAGTEKAADEALAAWIDITEADVTFVQDSKEREEDWLEQKKLLAKQGAWCKLPEQEKAYLEEEKAAALAYAKAEQEQSEHLGRMLVDYTYAMGIRNGVSQRALDQMTAGIRQQFGIQESIAEMTFRNARTAIDDWAASGGANTQQVIASFSGMRDEAVATQLQIEDLTEQMTDRLAEAYVRGEISRDEYVKGLQRVPSQVTTQLGLTQSGPVDESFVLDDMAAHDEKLTGIQEAHQEQREQAAEQHAIALVGIDLKRAQDTFQVWLDEKQAREELLNEWLPAELETIQTAYDNATTTAALAYAQREADLRAHYGAMTQEDLAWLAGHRARIAMADVEVDQQIEQEVNALWAEYQRLLTDADPTNDMMLSEFNARLEAIIGKKRKQIETSVTETENAALPLEDALAAYRQGERESYEPSKSAEPVVVPREYQPPTEPAPAQYGIKALPTTVPTPAPRAVPQLPDTAPQYGIKATYSAPQPTTVNIQVGSVDSDQRVSDIAKSVVDAVEGRIVGRAMGEFRQARRAALNEIRLTGV